MIKTLAAANKSERETFKIPRSVQQSIPIQRVFRDGIWQMGRNRYSRTYLIRQSLSAGGNGLDAGRMLRLQQNRMGTGDQGELLPVLSLPHQLLLSLHPGV